MNPRVLILAAVAVLFVATFSMDKQRQATVLLARKAQHEQATASAPAHDTTSRVSLLNYEAGDVEERATLRLIEHESMTDKADQIEMGWECFPTPCEPEPDAESATNGETSVEGTLISRESSIAGNSGASMSQDEQDAANWECNVDVTSARDDEIPMDKLWIFGGIDISLPRDIVAGEYRVVSDRGDVRSLKLTPADLEYHDLSASSPAQDLYMVDANGARWYFIRVKPAAEEPKSLAVLIDWQAVTKTVESKVRSRIEFALFRWTSVWNRLQRQVNAVGRRSQTWSDTMTQAIWHTLRSIGSARRISAEELAPDARY
jgi:hypothetical protein